VGAEAVCKLPNALDCHLASLAHDVRRPEHLRDRDPVWMTAQEHYPLGTQTLGSDHAAQADGPVSDESTPATNHTLLSVMCYISFLL
jgi:hypothetical protein